nr:MAG: hypothetical protein [Chiromantes dehaani nimavirus]
MEVHHHRSDKKQSKAEKKRKKEEKEAKRTEKEYRRRKHKEKRAQREIEKNRHLFLEEQQENPPRNVLTANSMRAAVEGIEAAIYDLGGVGGTGKKKKIPIKDVLRVTKMVAAALFVDDDVDDFIHNYLQDFRFDTVAVDLIMKAVQTLNTAYDRSADILGRENVECEYARTCTTPFHQPSTYKEAAPLLPAGDSSDDVNPLIIDEEADGSDVDTTEEAEENNRENQEKAARIKKRMLDEENDKIQTWTPVKNDVCFYMLNTLPTEDEATEDEAMEDDDVVGGGFSPSHRPTAYDTPPPREEHVFRIPVGIPPSARRVGRINNNAGRPLRAAAFLARQREQLQRLTTGGFDSSFSSTEEDFLNDSNYEPVTTDFGSDSEFDIEEVRRLRRV